MTWLPRGGKLQAQFKFTYLGVQRKEWLPYPDTPANRLAADEYATEIRLQIARGTFRPEREFPNAAWAQDGPVLTLKEAFAKWLTLYEQGHVGAGKQKERELPAPKTVNAHTLGAAMWCNLLGADLKLTELTYEYLEDRIAARPWPRKGALFNYRLDLLRMVCRYWRRRYPLLPDLYAEACEVTQHRKRRKTKVDPLEPEEQKRVLDYMREKFDARVYWYFVFQFATGMRPGETVALLWKSTALSAKHPYVNIERTRSFRSETREGEAKTENSLRIVELTPNAIAALSAMRSLTAMKPHGHVFENPTTGRPWASGNKPRENYWNPTLLRLKIAHRTAYCCRHTFATRMIMSGARAKWLATHMGTSLTLLDKTYTKWLHLADEGHQIERYHEHDRRT